MAITDKPENLTNHSTGHLTPKGWRVLSNPTRQPDPEADELKLLIQTMRKLRQVSGKHHAGEADPPEAA